MLWHEPASIIVLAVGALQGVFAALFKPDGVRWQVVSMVVSGVFMMLAAQSISRFVRFLLGQHVAGAPSVLALTVLSVVCLVHLTIGIRWMASRKPSSKS